jgi:signal transduction histidine kinase
MRIPEIRSYFRMVLIFFGLLWLFFIYQGVIIHFGLGKTILPRVLQEKQEMLQYIKADIRWKFEHNPDFDLRRYIAKENRNFHRTRLAFVPYVHRVDLGGGNYRYQVRRNHKMIWVAAEKIAVGSQSGYLIFFSNDLNRIAGMFRMLSTFMLMALGPALIFGFLIFRWLYRRSSTLLEAVERLSRGQYQTRVTLRGNDEFASIGRALNEMAASIEKFTGELQAIDRQRRQFIVDISHELSTPLTSIKGYLETLQMTELQLTASEQQSYLQIASEEAERLSSFVKELLELARFDAGTVSLDPDAIDCRQFLEQFKRRNELSLKGKRIELECRTEIGQYIYADYRRLEQILQNLFNNSLQHSDGLQKIIIECREADGWSVIHFRDDGSGIPLEDQPRIFERFYRAKKRGGESGNGLGLAIVKKLVELHGGSITVANGEDAGVSFTLLFPTYHQPTRRGPPASKSLSAGIAESPVKDERTNEKRKRRG